MPVDDQIRMSDLTEEWRPLSAPHVVGKFTPRRWDGTAYEPQWVEATCTTCGESSPRVKCDTGRVREKIAAFAVLHLHADPLKSPRVGHPSKL